MSQHLQIDPFKYVDLDSVVACSWNDPDLAGYGIYRPHADGLAEHVRDMDPAVMTEYLEYLDWLRGEGPVNMLGAGPYLAREYGLLEAEAQAILVFWMRTFSERHPVPAPLFSMELVG